MSKTKTHYLTEKMRDLCGGSNRGDESTSDWSHVTCPECLKWGLKSVTKPTVEPKYDPVAKPKHYNLGGIECIDAIEAATVGVTGVEAVCVGAILKYVWRHDAKNGTEDLEKARWYLERLIACRKKRGAK